MIRRIRELLFSLTGVIMAVLALSSFLVASYEMETWPFGDHRPLRERYLSYRARRQELDPFFSAPGQVESARRTVVKCELENMAGSSGGTTQGSSTILWLIPEGSTVKKADVLARLDASNYDEMLRQQEIVVEQARASHLQAQLDHEIAQIALREYMEGVAKETEQQMEASITLARSNLNQAEQRLEWTKKMNGKGYSSIAQMETDKQMVMTADLALHGQLSSYELFQKFTLPKTEKTLTADITTTRTTLESEEVKLNRQVERLKLLQKQVARCTLRAPHDGVVYYFFEAQRRGGNTQATTIEEGMPVYQELKLFYLPDLSDMEIQVILNESVVRHVEVGMGAHVEFEALPEVRLTGKVTNVSQIPNRVNPRGEDVRYFIGTVKLDRSAEGLKPGMTAAVTFDLPRREGVLAIPLNAVADEQDAQVCYVLTGDHLERRPVQLGTTTAHLVEVRKGLVEGDEVILNPPDRGRLRSLAGFEDRPWPKVDPAAQAAAARASGPRNPGGFGGGQRRKGGAGPGGGGRGGGGPGGGTRKSRKQAPVDDE
jgi:HlyD family secretion protein